MRMKFRNKTNQNNEGLFRGIGNTICMLFGIYGTFITIITITGEITVQRRMVFVVGFIIIVTYVVLGRLVCNAKAITNKQMRFFIEKYEKEQDEIEYIYTMYDDDLKIDLLVAVYHNIDGKNKVIGMGVVATYDNNEDSSYFQIRVIYKSEAYNSEWNEIMSNSKKGLEKTYITTSVKISDVKEAFDGKSKI